MVFVCLFGGLFVVVGVICGFCVSVCYGRMRCQLWRLQALPPEPRCLLTCVNSLGTGEGSWIQQV